MLFQLWGKADRNFQFDKDSSGLEARDYHPLIFHLLDVAACGEVLLGIYRSRLEMFAKTCGADADGLAALFIFLIALHDIGKCARGFQGKVLDLWPDALGMKPERELSVRHDAAGVWLFECNSKLEQIVEDLLPGLFATQRMRLIQAVCGHHGQPIEWQSGGNFPDVGNPKERIGETSEKAAVSIVNAMIAVMAPKPCRIAQETIPSLSFFLAGLAVLADWLGSNREWFPFKAASESDELAPQIDLYWNMQAKPAAARAIMEAGLLSAHLSSKQGLAALFDQNYLPTPLQHYAEDAALQDGPVLYIIEDMTGAGKTEAAVVLAHRLMLDGKAHGLHVALPTMATANAMFERLSSSYRHMFDKDQKPSVVLSHGRRDLFEGFTHLPEVLAKYKGQVRDGDDPAEIEASAFCSDWLARSNKQAFLAEVGAGTIDQAILGVLPVRHQSLRLWGLANKILVIDEAHAYDAYMGKEIERLLEFHAALGGSAIVLSATLTQETRASLVRAFRKGLGEKESGTGQPKHTAYPLVTSVARGSLEEVPLSLRDGLQREVAIERIGSLDEAHMRSLEAARRGAAVAVIRNTVNEAIESFEILSAAFEGVVILFHARSAMVDRQRVEQDVLNRFGKKNRSNRNAILVATQVIEQSLDLDFDFIVSDLAPVDLLIQRAGRLWRHERVERPVAAPVFHVLSPEPSDEDGSQWLHSVLPKTGFVYENAAVLWRSAKALFTANKIVSRTSDILASVESGEIRALVEAAYSSTLLPLPEALQDAETKAEGEDFGKRTIATFKLLNFEKGYDWDGVKWERDTKARTRLGEDTITLRLARMKDGALMPLAPVEQNDWRRAWALSEVNLRASQCTGSNNTYDLDKMVDKAKQFWSLSEKEMPTIILRETERPDIWTASVLDGKKKPMQIFYSAHRGFEFKGQDEMSGQG